ncbi:winged helix-turn-helix domain-containing protein [Piscinibacter sakaiensis]|uniref:DNA-binding domain of ModE n=1 Tax=Piscinibacter sakaiensis TaxID=1547922 RepID=A0A0K8NX76_PISS1|nr:winged helix-turn-helix domain-containing protein [Piscinibacter sakaiensis]GAP34981.1 DNA-binding domain of ModE [Piscinibacter sakaiensis]
MPPSRSRPADPPTPACPPDAALPPTEARPSRPTARFRLRVTVGDAIAIGPGKIALLEAIAATGSLTEAARHLGMSYRRAWLLLDQINRSLKLPAVDSAKGGAHGGGSVLTAVGEEVVTLYRGIEATAEAACADALKRLLALVAR